MPQPVETKGAKILPIFSLGGLGRGRGAWLWASIDFFAVPELQTVTWSWRKNRVSPHSWETIFIYQTKLFHRASMVMNP